MNRFYIVKEYIYYHMYKRRLTRAEFRKLCDIPLEEWDKIENNSKDFNPEILRNISKYISVPMKYLYIDLDNPEFKPFIDPFDNEFQSNKTSNIIFFD